MSLHAISRYALLEVLGEGPHGAVYKARDPQSGRWVAVKVFHAIQTADAGNLLALNHPHIATPCDIGRVDQESFAVTEYLPGGTLKNHIRSLQSVGDVFPLDQILAYAGQLGDALMYAHGRDVSHGNVKAENVMFGEDGNLKLTDFSLQGGSDFQAGRQADLAGFGSVLYELATAKVPFPGVAVQPADQLRKDLPAAFSATLSRIMNRDRKDRYEDLAGAIADLRAISDPQSVTAVSVGRPSATPALSPGRLLAGRFKIVRFIARGGMGDVYEAEDLELRERVALKTIRPDFASEANAMDRFKREIQLARRVTHENVCRLFDLSHDTVGAEKVTFLTMELLEGETLHQRMQRAGRIGPNDALPIIQQMAAGLAAAHRAEVIHRDFKSSNVILVPAGGDGRDFRAVVTDFGLARSTPGGQSAATLSNAGDFVGTPAYMAPEQLEGEEITASADIYAFGIVMYEMIAGTLPFTGDTTLAAALKRLQGPPASPRTHVPQLDAVWETSILRCLERRPADRFANVEELVKALAGETPALPQSPGGSKVLKAAPGLRRYALPGGIVVLLGLLLGVIALRRAGDPTPPEVKSRRAIAVLGFRNSTGDADAAWLSTALAEMLTTELAAGEKLRAIPGENVARMKVELALPESSSFAPDTIARIRNYLGADVIIHGSYVVNGSPPKVRIDLRLQDSVHGNLMATISQEGYSADLLDLVSRSGAELRDKLGVGRLEPGEAEVAHAAMPATPEAARYYAEGLEKLRVFDAAGARAALEKAISQDGRHALAHAALANSWSMLGHAIKARAEAKMALDLATKLSREDQLLVEAQYRETFVEWARAAEVYRTLFGFFPDNLDYGLRLAAAQTSANDGKNALATIEKLRTFPAPDGASPRIDLAEARAAGSLSDFKTQHTMATRAAAKGTAAGTKLLVAGARLIEGQALANLGEWNRARAAFEDTRRMYSGVGDRWDTANASTNLAYVVMKLGDLAGAQRIYEESLLTYQELGDQKGAATALASIATLLRNRGDLVRAKEFNEQALAIRLEIGDRIGEATSLNNLANISSLMGDQKAARTMFEKALPIFREIGDRNAVASVLSNVGDLVSEEGYLSRARELYEESRAMFATLDSKSSLAHALSRLGDLDLIEGDPAAARKRHEAALALRRQIGEQGSIGGSYLALAQIALHEGNAGAAEKAAAEAAKQFTAANLADDEASAMAVLAQSFLLQQKYAESARAIQRAEELSRQSSDRSVQLSVAITAASIRAAGGDLVMPLNDLAGIIVEARKAGLVRLELEAGLAIAEIEIAAGRFRAGRLRLEAVEREASMKGYKSIAARAAAAMKKAPAAAA